MAARRNSSARTAKVYLNPDLTISEQRSKRELLPVYRVLRQRRVPYRLHQETLVINNNVFCKSVPAQKYALDTVSVSDRLVFATMETHYFKRCFLHKLINEKSTPIASSLFQFAGAVSEKSFRKPNQLLLGPVRTSHYLCSFSHPYFGTLFQQNYNVLKITKSLKGKLKVIGKS